MVLEKFISLTLCGIQTWQTRSIMILIEIFLNYFSIGTQTNFGEENAPKRTHKGGKKKQKFI
jgi:hypothetical protein